MRRDPAPLSLLWLWNCGLVPLDPPWGWWMSQHFWALGLFAAGLTSLLLLLLVCWRPVLPAE